MCFYKLVNNYNELIINCAWYISPKILKFLRVQPNRNVDFVIDIELINRLSLGQNENFKM